MNRLFAILFLLASAGLLGAPSASAADEPSLFDLRTRLVDQHGQTVTLESLVDGHATLITMFYGSCHFACPMLNARVRRIEAKLPEADRAKLRILFVTFDPERDTVEALRKLEGVYSAGQGAPRWFLRPQDADAVAELAAVLGIRYRVMSDGTINHTSVITLLDGHGRVRGRMDGLDQPDEVLLRPLTELLAP
ncbi:MAG: SCO family protein [Myxococcaceae bacterium]|nr:SCO family protein [Myxococcaceae bacterium]